MFLLGSWFLEVGFASPEASQNATPGLKCVSLPHPPCHQRSTSSSGFHWGLPRAAPCWVAKTARKPRTSSSVDSGPKEEMLQLSKQCQHRRQGQASDVNKNK